MSYSVKLCFIWLCALVFAGCGKGPAGPAGSQGSQGNPGSPSYTIVFQNGNLPDSGYSGADSHWLDGSNPTTVPVTGAIQVATGSTTSNVALGLIRFDLSYLNGLPTNANITSASLQLTTDTTGSLSSGTYVLGVHQVIEPPAGNVVWNDTASWDVIYNPFGWNGGSSSPIAAGVDYGSTPLDTVTFTSSSVNGSARLLAWNIPPSLAQLWTSSSNPNFGFLLSFEPETGSLSGFISFVDDTGSVTERPKLVVEYIVP